MPLIEGGKVFGFGILRTFSGKKEVALEFGFVRFDKPKNMLKFRSIKILELAHHF